MDNKKINYAKALKVLIKTSGLTIDDFAKKANISSSLIRHANEDWNPKFETVIKLCSVLNISIVSFFAIAEHESNISNSITLSYITEKNNFTQKDLNLQLKEIRESSNLSKSQLAKKTGINKTNICNREHLKNDNKILCSTLEKYAYSFNLSMSRLCKILEEKTNNS